MPDFPNSIQDRQERLDRSQELYDDNAARDDRYGVRLSDAQEAAERASRELYWRRRKVRAALLFWSDDELDAIYAASALAGVDPAPFIRAAVKQGLAGAESEICPSCDGWGRISYNPNLNPNAFPAMVSAKCTRCGGTGNGEETKPQENDGASRPDSTTRASDTQ